VLHDTLIITLFARVFYCQLLFEEQEMKKVMLFLMLFSINVFAAPVNINKASAEEISASLKGVGVKKAEAIVKYRKANGAFSSLDDLTNVKGIGKKTLAANKADIKLGKKKKAKKKEKKNKESKK